jgi:hypothetical protein
VIGPWSEFAAVVLHAAPDAPTWSGPIKIVGRAALGGGGGAEALRYARPAEMPERISEQNPRPTVS